MYIDKVKNKVSDILNTDGRGNFKIATFNLFVHQAMTKRYSAYMAEVNQAVNRENRGLINGGLENIAERVRERIAFLMNRPATLTADSDGTYPLPENILYLDTVLFNNEITVDATKNAGEFRAIAGCAMVQPSQEFPIYLRTGNVLEVLPAIITTPLKLYYLRQPAFPNWTYRMINNNPVFDPDATDFVDIDLHPDEEENIVNEVLLLFGVNLKEPDVVQAAMAIENTETNLNTAS
jgi:hypothetical protein